MSLRGPLYGHIEFCRRAETLWGKLQAGGWDWIGVHPKGQLVLGRPSLDLEARRLRGATISSTQHGAREGRHGVFINIWTSLPSQPSRNWYADAAQARTRFEEEVERLDTPAQTPILAKVQLIEDGFPTDERFIVRVPPSTYR